MASVGRCYKHHEEREARRRKWDVALVCLGMLLGLGILVAGSTGYVAKVLWELRGVLGQ